MTVINELSCCLSTISFSLDSIIVKDISLWAYFILNMCPRVHLPQGNTLLCNLHGHLSD